jgi:hypothetical protein
MLKQTSFLVYTGRRGDSSSLVFYGYGKGGFFPGPRGNKPGFGWRKSSNFAIEFLKITNNPFIVF